MIEAVVREIWEANMPKLDANGRKFK